MNCRTPKKYFFPVFVFCTFVQALSATNVIAQNVGRAQSLQAEGSAKLDHWIDQKRITGDASNLMNQLTEAESDLKSSFDLFLQDKDYAGAARSGVKLGDVQRQRNQFAQAALIYQKTIELAKNAKRSDYETLALARLALTEEFLGKLDASKEHIGQAVKLGPDCGNKSFYFEALDTASQVAVKLGDVAAAADLLNRAFAMSSEVDRKQLVFGYLDRAEIYYKLVMTCIDDRKYDNVCHYSQEMAHEDYQAISMSQELGYQFLSQMIQSMMQDFMEKTTMLLQMIEGSDKRLASTTFLNPRAPKDVVVSESFSSGRADASTLAFYKSSLKEMQDWRSQMQKQGLLVAELNPTDFFLKGRLAEAEGDNDTALAAFRRSVELVEQDRENLQEERERSTFLEDKISYYYHAALLLLDRKDYGGAFSLFERSRARAMADMLASRPPNLGSGQERNLFSQLQTLRADIAAKQGKLFDLTSRTDRDQHATDILRLQTDIDNLQKSYQALEARIARDSPKLGQLTSQTQPSTLESVQRSAGEGGYDVLYYVVVEPDLVVWDINGKDVHVKKIFLPEYQLTNKIGALQESILARKHDASAIFDETVSRELFLFLVQPVLSSVASNHLVIIPHEQLNSLPFQVLQNPENNKFLGESFAISYAPSATVLGTLQSRANLKNGHLLAIADPLMHNAQDEVESIGKLYPRGSKVISHTPVAKTDLNTWVANYNLVHLSVHGKFDKKDPLLSYLQFERIPPEDGHIDDGHLTAAEMFGLPLQKNSLIILSACETGQVEASQANELLGMERSLLYAGAGDLVLSLWQVDAASTKLWMETFYEKGGNMSPAEAAKEALLAVKSHPEYSHPLYWAPFVMTGK